MILIQTAKITLENIPRHYVSSCLVLSICIEDYNQCGLGYRAGCEVDEANVLTVLGKEGYDFDIIRKEGRKIDKSDYNKLIRDARCKLKSSGDEYDAFMCIISAHGKADFGQGVNNSLICLSDGKTVRVKDDFLNKFKKIQPMH